MYSYVESHLGFGLTQVDEINCGTCCLSYTANTMPADALATLGARASACMVLTPQSQNIAPPASEELIKISTLSGIGTFGTNCWRIFLPSPGGGGGGGGVLGPKIAGGVPWATENWTQKDRGENGILGPKRSNFVRICTQKIVFVLVDDKKHPKKIEFGT